MNKIIICKPTLKERLKDTWDKAKQKTESGIKYLKENHEQALKEFGAKLLKMVQDCLAWIVRMWKTTNPLSFLWQVHATSCGIMILLFVILKLAYPMSFDLMQSPLMHWLGTKG